MNKTIWITGASSGIGEACTYEYSTRGYRLVLTSSSAERLAPVRMKCLENGAADVKILPYDLSLPDGIELLCEEAWNCFGGIDIM